MDSQRLHQPKKSVWYTRPKGIIFLIILSIFLSLSFASGLYVFALYRGLKSGKISLNKIFPRYGQDLETMVYGKKRPFLGEPGAPAVFAVFLDYECEECKRASEVMNFILADESYRDKVKFIIRNFPDITLRPNSMEYALAAECANEQGKFLEMHRLLFENAPGLNPSKIRTLALETQVNSIKFNECMDSGKYISAIEKDVEDGVDIRIQKTPAFVVGESIIEGAPALDELKRAVDALLK